MRPFAARFLVVVLFLVAGGPTAQALTLTRTITGNLASKSIVYSGTGLFFAQNMMYRHTIDVYDRDYKLVKVISDRVRLSDYGYPYAGTFRGAPVEAAFSDNGKYAWVTNYEMTGEGFAHPGGDDCTPQDQIDPSFVYKIDTNTFRIRKVIEAGEVPKFIAVTPDNRLVLVSNWCSWDLSVIDAAKAKTVRTVPMGRYPRGIAITADSRTAYVAVMGSYDIAVLDLTTFRRTWIRGVGRSPRHLVLSPDGKYLYATLNGEGAIAKVDLATKRVVARAATGSRPRSMTISTDGRYLYAVNYDDDTVSKVDTATMTVAETVPTNRHPIGITFDPETDRVWVSCYSGTLMVFQDCGPARDCSGQGLAGVGKYKDVSAALGREEKPQHDLSKEHPVP